MKKHNKITTQSGGFYTDRENTINPDIISLTSNHNLYEIFKVCKKRCKIPILETVLLNSGSIYCWVLNKKNTDHEIILKKQGGLSLDFIIKHFSDVENSTNSYTKPAACFIKTRRKKMIIDNNTDNLKETIMQNKPDLLSVRKMVDLDPSYTDLLKRQKYYCIMANFSQDETNEKKYSFYRKIYSANSDYLKYQKAKVSDTEIKDKKTLGNIDKNEQPRILMITLQEHKDKNLINSGNYVKNLEVNVNKMVQDYTNKFSRFIEGNFPVHVHSISCKFFCDKDKKIHFLGAQNLKVKLAKTKIRESEQPGILTTICHSENKMEFLEFAKFFGTVSQGLGDEKVEPFVSNISQELILKTKNPKVIGHRTCKGIFCSYDTNPGWYLTYLKGKARSKKALELCKENIMKMPNNKYVVTASLLTKIKSNLEVIEKILDFSNITKSHGDSDLIVTYRKKDLDSLKSQLNQFENYDYKDLIHTIPVCEKCFKIMQFVNEIFDEAYESTFPDFNKNKFFDIQERQIEFQNKTGNVSNAFFKDLITKDGDINKKSDFWKYNRKCVDENYSEEVQPQIKNQRDSIYSGDASTYGEEMKRVNVKFDVKERIKLANNDLIESTESSNNVFTSALKYPDVRNINQFNGNKFSETCGGSLNNTNRLTKSLTFNKVKKINLDLIKANSSKIQSSHDYTKKGNSVRIRQSVGGQFKSGYIPARTNRNSLGTAGTPHGNLNGLNENETVKKIKKHQQVLDKSEKKIKLMAIHFGQTFSSLNNNGFCERIMAPYKGKMLQNEKTGQFYKLMTNKLSELIAHHRAESRIYAMCKNSGQEIEDLMTNNAATDITVKVSNFYNIYTLFYGNFAGFQTIISDLKQFKHQKKLEKNQIQNDIKVDLDVFLTQKYAKVDRFVGVRCEKLSKEDELIDIVDQEVGKKNSNSNKIGGYNYKFNTVDYKYSSHKNTGVKNIPIYKNSSKKSSVVTDMHTFLRKSPNLTYNIYMDTLKFDKVGHRNSMSYMFLEHREHQNKEEYFFKNQDVINLIIDYFISEIHFLVTDHTTVVPWAQIDCKKISKIMTKNILKDQVGANQEKPHNNLFKGDLENIQQKQDFSDASDDDNIEGLKKLIDSKKSSAKNKDLRVLSPNNMTSSNVSKNETDKVDNTEDKAGNMSNFTMPSLLKRGAHDIRNKFQVIFHDIFDDFSKTFIWAVQNYETFKDYKILIWNYPGQPLSIFDETKGYNNFSLAQLIDEVLGCLEEQKIFDFTKDIIYFAGFGFGCNIAQSYILSQPDTGYVKGLILENGQYNFELNTVKDYLKELTFGFEYVVEFKNTYLLAQALSGYPLNILDKDFQNRSIMITPYQIKNRLFLMDCIKNSVDIYTHCNRIKNRLYVIHSKLNTVTTVHHAIDFVDRCTECKQKKFKGVDLYANLINDNGHELAQEFSNAMEFFSSAEENVQLKAFYTGINVFEQIVVDEFNKNIILEMPIKEEIKLENET